MIGSSSVILFVLWLLQASSAVVPVKQVAPSPHFLSYQPSWKKTRKTCQAAEENHAVRMMSELQPSEVRINTWHRPLYLWPILHPKNKRTGRTQKSALQSKQLQLWPSSCTLWTHFHTNRPNHLLATKRIKKDTLPEHAVTAVDPHSIFFISNVLVMPFYSLLLAAPEWKRTKALITNDLYLMPLLVLYIILLGQMICPIELGSAWLHHGGGAEVVTSTSNAVVSSTIASPLSFLKIWWDGLMWILMKLGATMLHLSGFKDLLSSQMHMATIWIHFLLLDLYMARRLLLAAQRSTPKLPAKHTILLCWMFGPLGFLSHVLTSAIFKYRWSSRQNAATSS